GAHGRVRGVLQRDGDAAGPAHVAHDAKVRERRLEERASGHLRPWTVDHDRPRTDGPGQLCDVARQPLTEGKGGGIRVVEKRRENLREVDSAEVEASGSYLEQLVPIGGRALVRRLGHQLDAFPRLLVE